MAGGQYSAVLGGYNNYISAAGNRGVISAGEGNSVILDFGVVPGGRDNTAAGSYSFAAGRGSSSGRVRTARA